MQVLFIIGWLLGTTKWTYRKFRSEDRNKFQFFLLAAFDRFLDIGTDNKSTLLGEDTATANQLSTAFFVKGFILFYWKGITAEHTFIALVLR